MNKVKFILVFLIMCFMCGCTQTISSNSLETSSQLQSKEESTEPVQTTSAIYESKTDTENSRYKDSQIASVYRDVLNNKLQFYSTDEQEWTYLSEFDYYDGEQGQDVSPLKFRLVDINGDGNFEIQIVVTTSDEYPGMRAELLYYEDGNIYGYMLPRWISGGVRRDKIVEWNSVWLEKADENLGYNGLMKISIENLELHYTFLFKESGSEEEEWLRANSSLIENFSIEYVGDKYDEYEDLILNTNEYAEYNEENIDKYIR